MKMIAEPYILTKGERAGDIEWCGDPYAYSVWMKTTGAILYADFEREKWKELGVHEYVCDLGGFKMQLKNGHMYDSVMELRYCWHDFESASESSRLLKRAEFLKAVCEKEGVSWPGECACGQDGPCKAHADGSAKLIYCKCGKTYRQGFGYKHTCSVVDEDDVEPIDVVEKLTEGDDDSDESCLNSFWRDSVQEVGKVTKISMCDSGGHASLYVEYVPIPSE